jgi:glycosyltransferase involved in cell wall biosynthesis
LTRISVVIAAYNAAGHLERCLVSITGQRPPVHELIVVDDGSVDATADMARRAGARVISLPRRGGPAAARNVGVRHASGDVVAFLDSDAVAHPGWSAGLLDAFDRGAVFVAGRLVNDAPSTFVERYAQQRGFGHDLAGANGFLPAVASSNMAVTRPLFWDVGGFDPLLRAGEDDDLAYRAGLAGHIPVFAPSAAASHRQRARLLGLLAQLARNAHDVPLITVKYENFPFFNARRRGRTRRPMVEFIQGAAWSVGLGWREGASAAATPWLDGLSTLTLRTSEAVGWLRLAGRFREAPQPIWPLREQVTATPLSERPALLVEGDDDVGCRAIARALRAHPKLSLAPRGLNGEAELRWTDPAPWSLGLVRRARADGWRLKPGLAARRLERVGAETWGEAFLGLHAVHAWLAGKAAYALVVEPAFRDKVIGLVGDVPTVRLGDDAREGPLLVGRRDLLEQPERVARAIQEHAGLDVAPSVGRVLRTFSVTRWAGRG